jgi:hypothetical protein
MVENPGGDFLAYRDALISVIERHLPGNFEGWEEAHSTWDGDVKTVHEVGNDTVWRQL